MIAYIKKYIVSKIQSIFGKENIKQVLTSLEADPKPEVTKPKKSTSSRKKSSL
jgi:hypothetical protein